MSFGVFLGAAKCKLGYSKFRESSFTHPTFNSIRVSVSSNSLYRALPGSLAFTMPGKGAPTRLNPVRLQTIQHLRVKRPNKHQQNACVTIMSSVLNCWASAGYTAQGCQAIEDQLKKCMDSRRDKTVKQNTINYHLMRMFPKVVGPIKKQGRLS